MIINGRYFLDDAETGLYEVTKSEYEDFHLRMDRIKEMFLKPNIKAFKEKMGKVMILSTTADSNDNFSDFKNLWNE